MENFEKIKSPDDNLNTTRNEESLIAEKVSSELEHTLERDLNKERGPKIKIKILFGAHGTAEEAEQLRGPLSQADIFIPELAGWDVTGRLDLDDLSLGSITPEVLLQKRKVTENNPSYKFLKREFEILYQSGKIIGLIDVTKNDPLYDRLVQTHFGQKRRDMLQSKNFAQLIEDFKRNIQERAQVQRERENLLVDNLESELKDLVEKYSYLKNKKEVNALLFLGAVHTRVYHILYPKMEDTSRNFGKETESYRFGYDMEALRRYIFNKEISDELAARAILETVIASVTLSHLQDITSNFLKIMLYLKKVVKKFSIEEIRKILESNDRSTDLIKVLTQKHIY